VISNPSQIVPKFARANGGAAAVEFSLIAICFLAIVLGVIEVATYIADKQDLMSAVHAAGRYAIVHGASSSTPASASTLQQMVANRLVIIKAASVTATASFSPNNSPGSTVTITARYTWTPFVASTLVPLHNATISATAVETILN
jgi:Flp pilus assembly protein TadG